MNIPVILYGDDGSLLNRIESQRGRVSVARTVQDFSEAVGMAHTGIARVLLCVHVPAEMSASTVDALAASEVLLAVIAPDNLPLPTQAHRIRPEAALEEILGSLEQAVDAALARPSVGYGIPAQAPNQAPAQAVHHPEAAYGQNASYGYDAGYGYDNAYGGYGYDNGGHSPAGYESAGYGYDPAAGAATNAGAHYGADYGSYGIEPAAPAPGVPGAHDSAEASSTAPSNEESVLSQAAAIVDSFAPGSDYALHVQNENNDGTLPQHPDINQDPAAPSRYQPGHRLGKIVTVWGTHGAPGRSTIAFNLAALAAQQGQQVCLIDADTYAPSLDALMALEDTGSGLAILCSDADRAQLDEKKAGAIMERVPLKNGTFDFLSGITSSSRWPEVRARAFTEVLEWLKHRYDLVICDVAAPIEVDEELTFDGPAPRRNAATLTALACADRVIALGEADVIGLPRLINLAREVQARPELFAPETDVQYWLNRSRREAAGFNPEAKMRDNWARYLSVPLTGVIPYERKVMDRLRRNGEALLEVAPRHAVVQSFEAMLEGMYAVRPGA
ncbi:P-loop NTPase [uncultured Rothia sp.]|uniref:AAA family ATPase n=1 Tax=uncultured Rothia sp. TaxID=316088 RepID=UPI0028DCE339|nr:P-loop NTPase [uncultured Rothia sp.]